MKHVAILCALAIACAEQRDPAATCERIRQMSAAPTPEHLHADDQFDVAQCRSRAQRMIDKHPAEFDCMDTCSHHLGLGEFNLCARRCQDKP